MKQPDLQVVMIPTDKLVPYANNANIHTQMQIEQIASSIEEFGFADPIGVWENENGEPEIVEGHGRVLAAKEKGINELPVIYLNYLSDDQRRAYTHVHNQLTRNSEFDWEIIDKEISDLPEFDWSSLGFAYEDDATEDELYTVETNIPQYEITGDRPELGQLFDARKCEMLIKEIEESDIGEDEKEFLRFAATRHIVFDYGKIAEYYANATANMQCLMEKSALVIIDYDDAIRLGYSDLSNKIDALMG